MTTFKRIGVTVKSDLDDREEILKKIISLLQQSGAEVVLDIDRCVDIAGASTADLSDASVPLDLMVIIGGDGTILRTVRELKDFSTPLLSVNRGAVGFLAEMNVDEADEVIPSLLSGNGIIEERSVLCIEAKRKEEVLFKGYVLNEAVISQGSIARLINLKTAVNGEELTTYRADGLILSTPTGSTAYSLAAGGPIVHPSLSALILTPINSHSFSQKPIVIPGEYTVDVEVLTKDNKFGDADVSLTLDGQTYLRLQRGDTIHAHINAKAVKFLRRKQDTFFGTLREKLKWGDTV
jgi:NAD+ kinase